MKRVDRTCEKANDKDIGELSQWLIQKNITAQQRTVWERDS